MRSTHRVVRSGVAPAQSDLSRRNVHIREDLCPTRLRTIRLLLVAYFTFPTLFRRRRTDMYTPRDRNASGAPVERRYVPSGLLLLGGDVFGLLAPSLFTREFRIWHGVLVVFVVTLNATGHLYRPRLQALLLDELPQLAMRFLAAAGVIGAMRLVLARRMSGDEFHHHAILVACGFVGMLLCRTIILAAVRRRRRRRGPHPVILVGGGELAPRVTAIINSTPNYGLQVVGYVADEPHGDFGVPYLGVSTDLIRVMEAEHSTVAVVLEESVSQEALRLAIRQYDGRPIVIFAAERFFSTALSGSTTELIGPIAFQRHVVNAPKTIQRAIKRLFDIFASSLALFLLSPLLLLIALLVRIDGGPGVLFRQIRVGIRGEEFTILKFRSMRPSSEVESQTKWNIANDSRVSAIGKFLRRTSLDELPQLWSILKGDMTIVGPRPERPHFVEKFSASKPDYVLRHRVPVGLTGLAQVNGLRGDTSIEDRADFDNFYAENWSFWLDCKILFRTVSEVVRGSGG